MKPEQLVTIPKSVYLSYNHHILNLVSVRTPTSTHVLCNMARRSYQFLRKVRKILSNTRNKFKEFPSFLLFLIEEMGSRQQRYVIHFYDFRVTYAVTFYIEDIICKLYQINVKNNDYLYIFASRIIIHSFDFDKKKLFFTYNAPKLILLGKYSISGRILVLPINGKGDINTTLIEPKLVNEVNLTFHEKDGEEFMALDKNLKVTTTVKRVYMHLTNLFNGNELLGREMNNFLNENWKEVSDEQSILSKKNNLE
ncbi:hypothetical protein C0J52_12952 [Blattella germanica]|nr:hypothetical protein C0J52_12952 [Blattella germanica]